jgi:tRNA threonylcarbamoyladenosine biosynthesis protein TsaB
LGGVHVIVLAIDTSTRQTSVAFGSHEGIHASTVLSTGKSHEQVVLPAVDHLLHWSEIPLSQVGGTAVGIGPGLFTGLRVGVETAKTLAQVLHLPLVGLPSLDVLAFAVRHVRRMICAVIDARRGEVFFGMYRPVPAGVSRTSEFMVGSPDKLVGELEASAEEVLLVGDGALRYRRELETLGAQVEFASPALAHPRASAMIELSIPRFLREDYDRLFDVAPLYLRKSDAEIGWDKRARAG